ncbi:MAG: MBL fold metallo-hydrolase [Phycisphaerales bacterium]|jgi:glyoxylase-like metal-dependent hydrolase (beta-lactamase superfamily II)
MSTARLGVLLLATTLASPAFAQCGIGDFDQNGMVDGADLGVLLGAWGAAAPGTPADLDDDGKVDGSDLGIMLGAWGEVNVQGGVFPNQWISGAPQCAFEPQIQVHWYNPDLCIMRQSLCTNFEGPFITLLFGADKVLMMDTGAGNIQIAAKVTQLISEWLAARGQQSITLIVAHTHGHGDHVAGDSQFMGLPNTIVVGKSQAAVKAFFGIANWPTQIVTYDLGGDRIVDIIPIPGHQNAHIAFYDRVSGILFTGDTLYPGRLYISAFNDYLASIDRLVDFTADKPVCWVLGTHIEMTKTPGVDFPMGATSHPNEHALQLTRAHLLELQTAIHAMQGNPHYEVHDDFIVFPLGGVAGGDKGGGNANDGGVAADPKCCARPSSLFDFRRLREAAR